MKRKLTTDEIDALVTSATTSMVRANEEMVKASLAIADSLKARQLLDRRLINGLVVKKNRDGYCVYSEKIEYYLSIGFLSYGFVLRIWADVKRTEDTSDSTF